MKVYFVVCENEYGSSIDGVFDDESKAQTLADMLNKWSENGAEPIQEWVYGHYSVRTIDVNSTITEWCKTWKLGYSKMYSALPDDHPLKEEVRKFGK
jgi:hypothetical protein